MFEYNICNQNDNEIFKKQCTALEKNIPEIIKSKLLTDVDGSQTQIYLKGDKRITVHNSVYLNEVYIKSDVDLDLYFH